MNQKDFIRDLNDPMMKDDFDEMYIRQSILRAIDTDLSDGYPRGHNKLIIVNEELNELGQQVSKQLRGKGDFYHTLEETADVAIAIYYLMELCGISKEQLAKAINVKLNVVNTELDKSGIYR